MTTVVDETTGRARSLLVDVTGALKVTSAGGGGGAATIADGADVNAGAIADAAVAAGATGTLSAKLRAISRDIGTLLGYTDGIETLQGTANTSLGLINTDTTTVAGAVASARMKTSPIVGQSGVAAGSGVIDATTLRTTAATDDILRPVTKLVTVSKTRPADTTAYSAGDVVNESTSAGTYWTFSSMARANGLGGVIQAAIIVDSIAQPTKPDLELWLFDTAPANQNDNVAFAPSDAECETLVGIIPFAVSDFKTGSGNGAIQSAVMSMPFQCTGSSTTLYGVLVARNAYTPGNAEKFTIRLRVMQD